MFGSILSYQSTMEANQSNLEFAKRSKMLDQYNTNINRAREDTAVQRRAADMEAAGINPLMAAGQPASAGQVVSGGQSAGQTGVNLSGGPGLIAKMGNMVSAVQDMRMQNTNIAKGKADVLATMAEADKTVSDAQWIDVKKALDQKKLKAPTMGESRGGKWVNDAYNGINKLIGGK